MHNSAMTAVLFPIAANAEAALARPIGRAARAAEASGTAGDKVTFTSELTGPAFPTRDAALDAYAGRLDDERPGRVVLIQPEDRFCDLRELAVDPAGAAVRQRPVFEAGHRWPKPRAAPATAWRLSVSYWRTAAAEAVLTAPPGEAERRRTVTQSDDAEALRQRAARPLRPLKPQQPLDIGLFEMRPPDAPHIVIPDE
jgi:hypothetical protein